MPMPRPPRRPAQRPGRRRPRGCCGIPGARRRRRGRGGARAARASQAFDRSGPHRTGCDRLLAAAKTAGPSPGRAAAAAAGNQTLPGSPHHQHTSPEGAARNCWVTLGPSAARRSDPRTTQARPTEGRKGRKASRRETSQASPWPLQHLLLRQLPVPPRVAGMHLVPGVLAFQAWPACEGRHHGEGGSPPQRRRQPQPSSTPRRCRARAVAGRPRRAGGGGSAAARGPRAPAPLEKVAPMLVRQESNPSSRGESAAMGEPCASTPPLRRPSGQKRRRPEALRRRRRPFLPNPAAKTESLTYPHCYLAPRRQSPPAPAAPAACPGAARSRRRPSKPSPGASGGAPRAAGRMLPCQPKAAILLRSSPCYQRYPG
mmetsp:Transcript_168457/g.541332  ORF Transcript_168457/g.541332 Transcript_168457/m.541332 type:complete len:372 (+) Transcript_168457:2238-3353(+)